MAVSYVSVGNAAAQSAGVTTVAGVCSITPTMPSGAASGDRIFVYQTHTSASGSDATPANWTALYKDVAVGTGAVAAGSGTRYVSCYYRDYDGSWSMPAFTLPSATQLTHAIGSMALRKASTEWWDTPTFSGPQTSFAAASTSFSAATPAAFNAITGALLTAHAVTNDNVTATTPTITGSGFTSGTVTERVDGGSATGNDVSIKLHTCSPSAGANVALTHTLTLSLASQGGWIAVQQTASTPTVPFNDENMTRVNQAVPAGVAGCWVTTIGGGAGGTPGSTGGGGGPGGGGGGRVDRVFVPVASLGATFSQTRGKGGASGANGTASTFTSGSVSISAGGGTGSSGGTSSASGVTATTRTGANGGAGSTINGTAGSNQTTNGGAGGGGGGQGGLGSGAAGGNSTTRTGGSGGTGAGSAPTNAAAGDGGAGGGGGKNGTGGAGGLYGGGGGGGGGDSTGYAGGVGGDGYLLVEWVLGINATDPVGITDSATVLSSPIQIVGSAAADATSITLPSHQAGDLLIMASMMVDFAPVAPTTPAAGGSVPTWTDQDSTTAAFYNGCKISTAVATSSSHTSGTWTGAEKLVVFVLRGVAASPIGGHAVTTGTGTAVTSPSITPTKTDGTSLFLHFHVSGDGVNDGTISATAPTGFARLLTSNTSMTVGFMAVNAKGVSTSDGACAQVCGNTWWSAFQIEVLAGAGGTDYTPSKTESVSLTDTLAKDRGKTVTDAVGITDSMAKAAGKTATDAVGLTDAFTKDAGKTATDAVGLDDDLVVQQDWARSVTDAVGITDTLTKDQGRAATDSVGLTDALAIGQGRTSTDPVGVTDSATFVQSFARTPTDAVGIDDTATVVADYVRSATDPVGIDDAATTVVDAVRWAADLVGIADSATFDYISAGQFSTTDPVGLTDAFDRVLDAQRSATDPVGVDDTFDVHTDFVRSATDPVGVTDSTTLVVGKTATDPVGVDDTLQTVLDAQRSATDPAGITDTISTATDFVRSRTNAVGITDSATFERLSPGEFDVNDLVGITDSLATVLDPTRTDGVGIDDTISLFTDYERSWTDPVGVADSATFVLSVEVSGTDPVGVEDELTIVSDYAQAWTDPVGVADSATFQLDSLTAADPVGIADVLVVDYWGPNGDNDTWAVAPASRVEAVDAVSHTDVVAAASREHAVESISTTVGIASVSRDWKVQP